MTVGDLRNGGSFATYLAGLIDYYLTESGEAHQVGLEILNMRQTQVSVRYCMAPTIVFFNTR